MSLNGRYKQIGIISVAAAILGAVFIPFPAEAFVADLSLPDSDPSNVPRSLEGSKFLVTIDIAPGELISMSQIEILLDNETPEVKRAIFDPSGNHVSGDSDLTKGSLKVKVPSDDYAYAYGYGYGYGSVSYGTSFSPPYSYSFTTSQDFISGNEYGYSYAVPNANLVNGFLGPATITIEGKLNTALLDEGTHTLDVLVHTGSGGNGIDKVVPPQLEFNISSEVSDGSSLLTVDVIDTEGNPITGVWTVVLPEDGTSILDLGFSPFTFVGEPGESYLVVVADYDGRTFQSWEDGSTERVRTVELAEGTTTSLISTHDTGDSLRGFTPLTYSSDVHHSLTVEAVNIADESEALALYTIIDPQSSDESSTTYRVYTHNYLDKIFRHWEDGSTDLVRTITIEEDTTITAHYSVDDGEPIAASFAAPLHGSQEVPPVSTDNDGEAILILSEDETELKYSLIVSQLEDVTAAHIHLAPPGENGGVVAFLFEEANIDDPDDGVSVSGTLVRGTITSEDLVGPLEGEQLSDLIEEMENGNAYVNAHTPENPAGEIRGQILQDESTDASAATAAATVETTEAEDELPTSDIAPEEATPPEADPLSAPVPEQEVVEEEIAPEPEPVPEQEVVEEEIAPEPEQQPETLTHEVSIIGLEDPNFEPKEITVGVGETITFENTDSLLHTATSIESHEGVPILDGIFDTGILSNGQTEEVTIDESGTYPYYCLIHPQMRGTVTVTG